MKNTQKHATKKEVHAVNLLHPVTAADLFSGHPPAGASMWALKWAPLPKGSQVCGHSSGPPCPPYGHSSGPPCPRGSIR
eukprot:1683407-Pyramimonas_sp.AAC.1